MEKKNKDAMFTHGSDEWHTHAWLFKQLDDEFNFVLDAAATKENALCSAFFSEEDDALVQDWPTNGWTFCIPESIIKSPITHSYWNMTHVLREEKRCAFRDGHESQCHTEFEVYMSIFVVITSFLGVTVLLALILRFLGIQ